MERVVLCGKVAKVTETITTWPVTNMTKTKHLNCSEDLSAPTENMHFLPNHNFLVPERKKEQKNMLDIKPHVKKNCLFLTIVCLPFFIGKGNHNRHNSAFQH